MLISAKCLEEDIRLSEEALERLSERLVNRVEKLNTYMIEKLGKQIVDIGTFTPSQVREVLQSVKYGNNLDEIMNEIADVSEKNVSDIYKIFEEVAKKNQNYAKQFYEYTKTKFIPYEQNEALQEQVKSIAKATANEYINMSKTFAYMKTNAQGVKEYTKISDVYQKITDEAILNIVQGRESYEMTMRKAMKEMTSRGLRTVDFNNGYSRRADSSIRMNVMDGIRRLNQELQKSFGEEFGADGIEVSHHKNAAPDHIDTVDGKQFSTKGDVTVKGIKYQDYATVNNSLNRHVGELNCYHFTYQIVLGVSEPIYSKEQLEADKKANKDGFDFEGKHYTNYEGTQLQRQIETKIRQYKDRQIGARAINNDEEVYHCQEKIRQLTNKYNDLHKASGLPTKIDRLRVDGYKKLNIKLNDEYMLTSKIKIGNSNDLIKSIGIKKLPNNHYSNIKDIIKSSDPSYKFILNKYKDDIKIKNYKYAGTPRYNPMFDSIKINIDDDKLKGYNTFFHEYSHMIDHKLKNPSQKPEFKGMIQNDFERFKSNMKLKYNIDDKEFYARMSRKMNLDNQYNSLSDIIGGITKNQCIGRAMHRTKYWEYKGKLEREFFAHVGSALARNSKVELYNFRTIFPNSYKYFINSMKGE